MPRRVTGAVSMLIRMRIARLWQDVGQERPLSVGETYDLPEAIAYALIATMAAERVVSSPERAVLASAPERKVRRSA